MKRFASLILMLFVPGCLLGCKAFTAHSGEWSVDFRQGISIKTIAAETTPVRAESGFEPTPLTEMIFKAFDSDGDGEPDTSEPVEKPEG